MVLGARSRAAPPGCSARVSGAPCSRARRARCWARAGPTARPAGPGWRPGPRCCCWAALAFLGARSVAGGHVGLVALAVVLGVGLNLGVRGWRLAAAAAIGGGVAYLGGFAAGQVMIARETAPLPGWLEAMTAATAMSIVCVAALLPRHLVVVRDAVAAARRALPAELDDEVRGLVDRGHAVWEQASPRLDAEGQGLLRDGVLRLYELAGRWARVDRPADGVDALRARAAELDGRVEASTDEVAREQYRDARAAIADQLRYVDGIQQSRERVLARLHACVATLEKFRLASAHLETASASRQAVEGRQTVALLAEVTADIDACDAALDELGGAAPTAEAAAAASPATAG
ncbi:MAG: hypothetical protein H6708_17120 [Kofleriaceae bacterium]|nr:hypothetical protein [Kofleriaceae bacterium]